MIDPARVQRLNDLEARAGEYVLYWMQASQRTRYNFALAYAVERANELKLAVVVGFGLMDDYPEANARHYAFMLQGLADVKTGLERRGIQFVIRRGEPAEVGSELANDAALVVCDRGYTRHQKQWREIVARRALCEVAQVEADVVVPVEVASDHQEFSARTIRPKIAKQLKRFLRADRGLASAVTMKRLIKSDVDVSAAETELGKLKVDRSVAPSQVFIGGEREAQRRLKEFVTKKLAAYDEARREPAEMATSRVSPYIHFGQISPVEIALAVQNANAPRSAKEAYLEELIIRRELSVNFVNYCATYDQYESVPRWAKLTLKQHARDKRDVIYTVDQLERAATHDTYWNAAQREMFLTGYMHNSMRMYWGKKIIEWSRTPQQAYQTALYLNNTYFIDGRGPTAFANIAWLFGLHDRPWQQRKIFGTVRYMNAAGLARKFDINKYVSWVQQLQKHD